MDTTVAASYLLATFDPTDRIALVLLHRPTGRLTQRFVAVATVAAPTWQAWLRFENARGREVYYSVNAYRPGATRRTKDNVLAIRHIFLDVDSEADRVLAALHGDRRLPPPHHIVRSSPERCQVLWRVQGFAIPDAETLQRGLALAFGADLAATDAARVARLPGLFNQKYQPHCFVRVTTGENLGPLPPTAFPRITTPAAPARHVRTTSCREPRRSGNSQSERDWQWVIRQLAGGRPLQAVERMLAERRPDKRHVFEYAARTVDAAWVELNLAAGRDAGTLVDELLARRTGRYNAAAYADHIVTRALTRRAQRSALRNKGGVPCAS